LDSNIAEKALPFDLYMNKHLTKLASSNPSSKGAWAKADYHPRTTDPERAGRERRLTHTTVLVDTLICSHHNRNCD